MKYTKKIMIGSGSHAIFITPGRNYVLEKEKIDNRHIYGRFYRLHPMFLKIKNRRRVGK